MNDLKIGTRLGAAFGFMLVLLLLIVGISYQRLAQSTHAVDALNLHQQRAEISNAWAAKTQLNVARAISLAKASGLPEMQAYFEPQIAKTSREISALQKTMTESIVSAEGQALLATVAERRKAYITAREQVFAHLKAADYLAATDSMSKAMLPASEAYVASMTTLQTQQNQHAAAEAAEVRATLRTAQQQLLGLFAAALAIGAGLAWTITRSVTLPLREALSVADVIAASNLSRDIRSHRKDELGDLLRSLSLMQGSLRAVVGQVRVATDSISTASSEIATGNADLASRTEHTSSNLQQAASSMEQLTGTVKQSADSARTANQLASSAASVAERGGQVVSQVVTTMNEINTSSKKIADIIGVIDGIAFQTNILALNAAVEAARAGEQGRGFAVVASEVRSLAQRSADAAKEIKSLIGASVDRVESGSKLVADAGSTMTEIVASVQRVSDIIGEITAASAEQSDGIGQVNTAVVQLDQMTQQNAALVEESAAAAESLKEQARQLGQIVHRFKLAPSA